MLLEFAALTPVSFLYGIQCTTLVHLTAAPEWSGAAPSRGFFSELNQRLARMPYR
jgi:hypothetical protein